MENQNPINQPSSVADLHQTFEQFNRVSGQLNASVDELELKDYDIAGHVQVSIGITLVRHSDDFISAFKRADKALYQAKLNGKNQIIIC